MENLLLPPRQLYVTLRWFKTIYKQQQQQIKADSYFSIFNLFPVSTIVEQLNHLKRPIFQSTDEPIDRPTTHYTYQQRRVYHLKLCKTKNKGWKLKDL